MPSEPQAFCAETRVNGASEDGRRVVLLTPVHTARDCEITCSISVNRPLGTELVRAHRTGRAAGNGDGLAHVRHNLIEGVAGSGLRGPA